MWCFSILHRIESLRKLLFFCVLINSFQVLATGLSFIISLIRPIAINATNDVLCVTKFITNEMGAYRPMSIEYGYCVLSKDSIHYLQYKILDPIEYDSEEQFITALSYYDYFLDANFDSSKVEMPADVFQKKYRFYRADISTFEKNERIAVSQLTKSPSNEEKAPVQKALKGARSREYVSDSVLLQYDFGKVKIFYNIFDPVGEGEGAVFNYTHPFIAGNKTEEIEFESGIVTGIFFEP